MTDKYGGIPQFGGKSSWLKRSGITSQGRKEAEVGTLLVSNDKSNVISNKGWSYFWCLSSKFEVYVARFGTKE